MEEVRDRLIEMIRDYLRARGIKRVVLGISGGKDSTVAAALCARAIGPENVFGIMLPDGTQRDIEDSEAVCKALRIQSRRVNIGAMHAALRDAVRTGMPEDIFPAGEALPSEKESDINVGPRLRMTVLRYIAQCLGAFLCGTGNLSERSVGYCTKDGDTSSDFNPLGALTSKEVVALGMTMPEIPRYLVEKAPSDGLSGKTDEERLGVTYQQIHDWIRQGSSGSPEADRLIKGKYLASAHKRRLAPILNPFTGETE